MARRKNEEQLQELWSAYLSAERVGLREAMRESLDHFVSALLAQDQDDVDRWALSLVERVVDHEEHVPIRFPLFRRVLGPALVRGVVAKQQSCARWLAHFQQELLQSEHALADLPESLRTASGLLQEALRVDPSDAVARRRLIVDRAKYLAYTIHELPAGVLYGHDGATIDECTDLLGSLDDFREHVDALGERARYGDLIAKCQHHFKSYRAFLSSRRAGQSYAEFLAEDRGA